MTREEIEKELESVESELFLIDMIDTWTPIVKERHARLFNRKLELKQMLRELEEQK